jgi:secreted Zn-dependent insulinase-like peptidase
MEVSSISNSSKRIDPIKIRHEDGLVVWHKVDHDFPVPKVVLRMRILSPTVSSSVESSVKLDLCLNIFSDYINEMSYVASMADLDSSINLTDTGK